MVKFTHPLSDYRYVLSFDLAKHYSGYSLIDTQENNLVFYGTIVCEEDPDKSLWAYMYSELIKVIEQAQAIAIKNDSKIFVIKEQMPSQAGKFTTAATLQGLAMAHAIWEIACIHRGIEVYDFVGVHAISEKAWIRSVTEIEKPTKEDVANYILKLYPNSNLGKDLFLTKTATFDVTDSIAVFETLRNWTWNRNIAEEVKTLKKFIKIYKTEIKKKELKNRIKELEKFKI